MYPSRNFIACPRLPGANAVMAFTLALTVMAGLGCDENVPTETRAPTHPMDVSGTEVLDDSDLAVAQRDVATMSIALPVNQSISTVAPAPAFRVTQTGSGPDGIFQISNTSNTQPALQGLNLGRGRGAFFRIQNSANTQSALVAQSNGSGFAVQGLATGVNTAGGSFEILGVENNKLALNVSTAGTGSAGRFEITNANNFQPSIHALTSGSGFAVRALATGTGLAGHFENTNANNHQITLATVTNGLGDAFLAYQNGLGGGGSIQINNAFSSGTALEVGTSGSGLALDVTGHSRFRGNVTVEGTLTKPAGSFRIDHPLDPEHKYLSHSFVESPDMKNVYDGTVTLDPEGRATVELPEYFEALNRDFRYQLTAIGSPGPNLYIAQGVGHNRFRIAGGRPYAHVSWQITGVRKDAYAEEHRIRVEEEKPRARLGLVTRR